MREPSEKRRGGCERVKEAEEDEGEEEGVEEGEEEKRRRASWYSEDARERGEDEGGWVRG